MIKRQRRADDARRIADDERHFLRRGMHRRHHEVALVLAVVVVDHDYDLTAGKGRDRRFDLPVMFVHSGSILWLAQSS